MPNNWPFTPSTPLMARLVHKKSFELVENTFPPRESSGNVFFFDSGISDLMKIDGVMLTGSVSWCTTGSCNFNDNELENHLDNYLLNVNCLAVNKEIHIFLLVFYSLKALFI